MKPNCDELPSNVAYNFNLRPSDEGAGGGGAVATMIMSEEDAETDAAERLRRLQALVTLKRLYFSIICAFERYLDNPPPEPRELKLDAITDLVELANVADDYEEVCEEILGCEARGLPYNTIHF